MAYGVDRYPNPPQYAERVVYYEREDGDLVRRVETDEEKEDGEDQE